MRYWVGILQISQTDLVSRYCSTVLSQSFTICEMNHLKWLFLIALFCPIQTYAQGKTSAQVPFAGCYQVVSQSWHPSSEDVKLIPDRFQLRIESAFEPKRQVFEVRSVPATGNLDENLWVWQPRGSRFWIAFATGLGGFRGTFKRSSTGEFVGSLKEWCDSRCEWKTRVGTIRIKQFSCTE